MHTSRFNNSILWCDIDRWFDCSAWSRTLAFSHQSRCSHCITATPTSASLRTPPRIYERCSTFHLCDCSRTMRTQTIEMISKSCWSRSSVLRTWCFSMESESTCSKRIIMIVRFAPHYSDTTVELPTDRASLLVIAAFQYWFSKKLFLEHNSICAATHSGVFSQRRMAVLISGSRTSDVVSYRQDMCSSPTVR